MMMPGARDERIAILNIGSLISAASPAFPKA
jgi:hypothetical protein